MSLVLDLPAAFEEAGLLQKQWRPPTTSPPTNSHHQAQSSRLERARGHEFGDQHDANLAPQHRLPRVVEADDVGVLQPLEHLHLLRESLPLRSRQFPSLWGRGWGSQSHQAQDPHGEGGMGAHGAGLREK